MKAKATRRSKTQASFLVMKATTARKYIIKEVRSPQ